jgi:hypothetical protein
MSWEMIGIWGGALLTLCLYSFLYRDNPFYKFAEHLFVGMSAGYWAVYTIFNVLKPNWWDKLVGTADTDPELIMLIPGVLAVLMLLRVVSKLASYSRLPLALIVGAGAGLQLVSFFQTNGLKQVENTVIPLVGSGVGPTVDNLLMVTAVVCGLVYFFFSKAHRGITGGMANVGITMLMVAFGASFGYTVMARISLLIGQAQFLLFEWVPTIPKILGV